MTKKIFITGATGCIGHYVLDELANNPSFELHLFMRDPKRLFFPYKNHKNIKIHLGNLERIEECKDILADMDYLIHIATDWSSLDYAIRLNLEKTSEMLTYLNPKKIKKIIYFSTASILGKDNKPIKEAGQYGPGYVRSKYLAYYELQKSPLKEKIITLFPTIVFGGDETHQASHINKGIKPNLHYLKILRFFYMDAKFHFLHSKDIASVTKYVLLNETPEKEYVLGNQVMTGKQAIKALCKFFKVPIYFKIKVTYSFVAFLAKLFKIQIDTWTKFCLKNPFFEYDVVNPSSFGLETVFPNLDSVLQEV